MLGKILLKISGNFQTFWQILKYGNDLKRYGNIFFCGNPLMI